MADPEAPRNRKERRAAAKNSSASTESPDEIPMKQPDRSGPKEQSLYDLAAERQKELEESAMKWNEEHGRGKDEDEDEEPLGPFAEAVIYSFSLSFVHLTLDTIVHQQYREEVLWKEIFGRAGTVFPVLMVIIWIFHSSTHPKLKIPKQLLFLGASVIAGCYMIYTGNKQGYYAVMKQAPPVGTIWIWVTIEMQLPFAVASLVIVAAYMLWNGFVPF